MDSPSLPTIHMEEFHAFECTSCGKCCIRPWRLQLEPELTKAITNSTAFATARSKGYVPIRMGADGSREFARKPNSECVFLDENYLCDIHAELGIRAKPRSCQTFPYMIKEAPGGIYPHLSFACPPVVAGLDRNVGQNREDLADYLKNTPKSINTDRVPQEFLLCQTHTIPWDDYLVLEQRILALQDPAEPVRSLIKTALAASRRVPGTEQTTIRVDWSDLEWGEDDVDFAHDILRQYVGALAAAIEDLSGPAERDEYSAAVAKGETVYSHRLELEFPPIKPVSELPSWVLKTMDRYLLNGVMGKALLGPTILSRLLTYAVGIELVGFYTEAFRARRGNQEITLEDLTDGFEIVEADVVTHSHDLDRYFYQLESSFLRMAKVETAGRSRA